MGKSPDFDSTCCGTVGIMDNVCDSYEPINDGEAAGLRQSFRVKLHRWVNADGNMISNEKGFKVIIPFSFSSEVSIGLITPLYRGSVSLKRF